jgi:hypothetical protein
LSVVFELYRELLPPQLRDVKDIDQLLQASGILAEFCADAGVTMPNVAAPVARLAIKGNDGP